MLKAITLHNFRIHKKLRIELDPHITTIVGKSYAGKSTVIRALKWLCLNRPTGKSVIRWGSKQAKVVLETEDHTIERLRGQSKNLYRMDGETYEAFGNDVPTDIAKVLNVSEINFQGQHHLPFWFGESAGEVSRRLNGIVNLGQIDSTLSKLASMLHKAKTVVEMRKESLDKIKQRKQELVYVKEMTEDWERVRDKHKRYTASETSFLQLQSLLERCERHQTIIEKTRPPSMKRLTKAWEVLERTQDDYESLTRQIRNVHQAKENVIWLRKEAKRKNKEVRRALGQRCPLCKRRIN